MTVFIHAVTFSDDESPLLKAAAKLLFQAYYNELGSAYNVILTYQGVQEELDGLPGKFDFGKRGGLWVASVVDDGEDDEVVMVGPGAMLPGQGKLTLDSFVGVVALRPLGSTDDATGEVKRMFVSKDGRRKGIAYVLSVALCSHAARMGDYMCLKLDSLERLPGAVTLYEKLGFRRCKKYCECPEKDHVCMEMLLAQEPQATG